MIKHKIKDYLKFKKEQKWKRVRRNMALRNGLSVFEKEFRRNMVTLITGAFAFVAALFWRDAIKPIFDQVKPEAQPITQVEILYNLFVAFIVSIIAIVAMILLSRLARAEK